MENVKELLQKIATKEISNDDIEQIDTYYSEHIDELLILDTDTAYFKLKNLFDDLTYNLHNNWDTYKTVFIVIGCTLLAVIVLIPLIKLLTLLKTSFKNKEE